MRDVVWRAGATLTALVALLFLGPVVSSNFDNRLVEQFRGQTPQAQIALYLAAVAEGDRQAAMALDLRAGSCSRLSEGHRRAVTGDPLAMAPAWSIRSWTWSGGALAASRAASTIPARPVQLVFSSPSAGRASHGRSIASTWWCPVAIGATLPATPSGNGPS
jgi:hypothetical protein